MVLLVACVQAQQPGPLTAQETLAAIELHLQDDANQAIRRLTAIVKKRPADADAWDALATVFYTEGLISSPRTAFERVISLRPESGTAHARLASALIVAG